MLFSLLALIVTLGVLVSFHEFGHFWVARRLGVKVLRFSVGFGKPLLVKRGKVDDTEFVLAAIPLGGYVKFLDEREGSVDSHEQHRAFNRQPVLSRIAIVLAGPIANFLFAILAYALMFMVGITGTRPLLDAPDPQSIAAQGGFQRGDLVVAVADEEIQSLDTLLLRLVDYSMADRQVAVQVRDADGSPQERFLDLRNTRHLTEQGNLLDDLGLSLWPVPAVVGRINPGSAADTAGLQEDDEIVAIDEEPIQDWQALVAYVQDRGGQAMDLSLRRHGEILTLVVTPDVIERDGKTVGQIGIAGKIPPEYLEQRQVLIHYGPVQSLLEATRKTADMSVFTLTMLGRMLVGQASLENISGPITIAQFAGQSASIGWVPFLSFLALVSISLGVLNLLPVPILDGGHLLYYAVELLKGSPLSEGVQDIGQRIGVVILFMLMSLAFVNDLTRLFQ